MGTKKIYIISRTKGLKPSTIRKNFRKAEKRFNAAGLDIANPHTSGDEKYSLLKNAYLLIKSPYVHATSNWENSWQTRWLFALARLFNKIIFL